MLEFLVSMIFESLKILLKSIKYSNAFSLYSSTMEQIKYTRILFQNVNSLELTSSCHTLELMCNSIGQLEIDIACLTETNTH